MRDAHGKSKVLIIAIEEESGTSGCSWDSWRSYLV